MARERRHSGSAKAGAGWRSWRHLFDQIDTGQRTTGDYRYNVVLTEGDQKLVRSPDLGEDVNESGFETDSPEEIFVSNAQADGHCVNWILGP